MEEISPEIQKGVRAALGERFRHGLVKTVQVEAKGEKTDNKILALKNCRAFILSSKSPPKLEHEFNYLELEQIESTKPKQIKLKLHDRKDAFLVTAPSPEESSSIIEFIAESLKRVFPHTPLENFFEVKLEPSERLDSLQTHLDCFSLPDLGPCGGFSQMYQFMCDFHSLPYMDEVAWDIDTIYLSQDSTELCLNDFDHLEAKDLLPIISALMYNTWFKKLTVKDIRLGVEATKEIISVVRQSACLEQLVLNNSGFKNEFAKELASALQENIKSALLLIDLSNNNLDDRGVKFLCPALANLQNGLAELNLSNTGITAEGVSALGKALSENNFFPTSLMRLNLSGNLLKEGNIELLMNFLAQPNHLTHLDLSECGIALDGVFSALFRGCITITHINFSGNVYSYKKGKEATVPQAVKQFFATTTKLQILNFSNCRLLPDAIKEIILGIGSNRSLEHVDINLSSNDLRSEGAKVIASCIGNVPNISSLNLSNNEFCADLGSLMGWISQNKVLTHLDISENLVNIRQKNLQAVLDAIVDLIQDESSPIRSLGLARNKLKFETIPIINALGSNTTLTSIDISGNQMGDIGARMLAKALQINCKLEAITLDNNGISIKGFQDIAGALERNYSLKSIPPPVTDLTNCLKSCPSADKAEAAFQRIQFLLQRNHSPQKFADAQAFRLQQGFLYTTSHQLVDKLVVQIQDACKELGDCDKEDVQENIIEASGFIKDADNSKQLLEVLREESRKNESEDVMTQLKEMAAQIHNSVEEKLKKTADGMIDGTKDKCPHVMENEELKENVMAVCKNRSTVPDKFVLSLIEQLNAQLSNQISESNLAMAAHISDTIIDEIIDMLMNSHQKLGKHLSKYRNRTLSLSLMEVNGPTTQDTVDHGELGTTDSPEKQQFHKKEGQSTKNDLREKRKSVKRRPKSVIAPAKDVIVQPEEDSTPQKTVPASTASSTPQKKKSTEKFPARAATNVDLGDFDAISSSSQRPLRDARLDRPRRVRNVRPTRAVAIPQKDHNPGQGEEDGGIQDVNQGVDDFYRPVEPELVAPIVTSKQETKASKKEKIEKVEKKKKGKDKDGKKKKEEKKKGGFFGGMFQKRKSVQPQSIDVKAGSSPRKMSEPSPIKPTPPEKEKARSPLLPEKKVNNLAEEDSEPPTPEYRSSEDDLSVKDENHSKMDIESKENGVVEEVKPPAPVKVALKPMPGKTISPNMLADLKAKQAKRKSKDILDIPPMDTSTDGAGTVPDEPKKEATHKQDIKPPPPVSKQNTKPPPPPVKPTTVQEDLTDGKTDEKEPAEPVIKPPEAEEEAEKVDSEVPLENGSESQEETPSPKKSPTAGQFVLPPIPVKKERSSKSSENMTDDDEAEGDKEEGEKVSKREPAELPAEEAPAELPADISVDLPADTTADSTADMAADKVLASPTELPALHENHEEQSLPADKEEEKPEVADIPFPEVLATKVESPPAEHASPPEKLDLSLTQDTEDAPSVTQLSSPVSPNPQSPTKSHSLTSLTTKPQSPIKPTSPIVKPTSPKPNLETTTERKPPSPTKTKEVNPLFIPKKTQSIPDKSSKEPPAASPPKKPLSTGAQLGVEEGAKDKKEAEAVEKKIESVPISKEEKKLNGHINQSSTVEPSKKADTNEKNGKINGEKLQKKEAQPVDGGQPNTVAQEKEEEEKSKTKRRSISDRMKDFQDKPSNKPEQTMSVADKRKSFEIKESRPTAAPRPKSILPGRKPAPKPRPQIAKRPPSEKLASPVQSPQTSIGKKAPPVAERKPVLK